jgi:hypothetical protein
MNRSRTSRSSTIPPGAGLLLLALLAACDTQPFPTFAGRERVDPALVDACYKRANEVYDQQNRTSIYAPQYGGSAPLSGTYTDTGLTRGLSARFGFEQMVQGCVRSANVAASRADAVTEGPAAAPSR